MKKLVLASSSPRRKQILSNLGVKFEVDPAQNFQELHPNEHKPDELLKINAVGKARDVGSRHENALVIGVDTIGVFQNHILEKPKDRAEAKQMIQMLQGEAHEVRTAICVIDTVTEFELTCIETTEVRFLPLSDDEIESYLDHEEYIDKAAAYAAQGKAAFFIESFHGDYLNVVGLSVHRLNLMLKEFDFQLMDVVE